MLSPKNPALLKENIYTNEPRHIANRLIMAELVRRGHQVERIGPVLFARLNGRIVFFKQSYSSLMTDTGSRLISNKAAAKEVLSQRGLLVAQGRAFRSAAKGKAWEFCQKFPSVVIKPTVGSKGRGVSVGVATLEAFERAWIHAGGPDGNRVLVEEEFHGEEARYLVVGNKCIAVYKKTPPTVVADGQSTVRELISRKNDYRMRHPHYSTRLINITDSRISFIERQGFSLESVPEKGILIYIDSMSSISSGGETHEITESTHEEMKRVAESAALAIPGADVLGIDIMSKDHAAAPSEGSYIIVEMNAQPGLGGHNKPAYGRPKNVIPAIVDNVERALGDRSKFFGISGGTGDLRRITSISPQPNKFHLDIAPSRNIGPFKLHDVKIGCLISYGDNIDESGSFIKRLLAHKHVLSKVASYCGFSMFPGQFFEADQKPEAEYFASALTSAAITPLHHNYSDVLAREIPPSFEKAWSAAIAAENATKRPLHKGVFVSPWLSSDKEIRVLLCLGKVVCCSILEGDQRLPYMAERKDRIRLRKLASSLPYPSFIEASIHLSKLNETDVGVYLSALSFSVDLNEYKTHHHEAVHSALASLLEYRATDIYLE